MTEAQWTEYLAILNRQVALAEEAAQRAARADERAAQNMLLLDANSKSLARQAAAMEGQAAALKAHTEALVALMGPEPPNEGRIWIACLQAAAEARIENEASPLAKAADALLNYYKERNPG